MVEPGSPAPLAGGAKRVNVILCQCLPAFKRNAQFNRALHVRQELCFRNLEQLVQCDKGWNGRLADANGSYLIRFN